MRWEKLRAALTVAASGFRNSMDSQTTRFPLGLRRFDQNDENYAGNEAATILLGNTDARAARLHSVCA
jgi:hypothetical protein